MSVSITVYRTPLSRPHAFSLHGDLPHPREAGAKEHLFLERALDDGGHETLAARHAPGGDVTYRRATRWEDARRTAEEEFFAETGATVTHEIVRGDGTETERILFDGELDSTIERTFLPDGTLASERVMDASGELTSLTERDRDGRVVRQVDPGSEQRFTYEPSGELAVLATTLGSETTVETTVFEAGLPTGTVISRDGKEIGRRVMTREGHRRVEEETRSGRVVSRRVEDLDSADRPVGIEETVMRGDGSMLETRHEQEWSSGGFVQQTTVVAWLTLPGGGRVNAGAGRRQMTHDTEGRLVELLLHDAHDEEFEDNSYYRFAYAQGG
jgi:YD repeat-containing protein